MIPNLTLFSSRWDRMIRHQSRETGMPRIGRRRVSQDRARSLDLEAVEGDQRGVHGKKIAARSKPAGAHILGRLNVELLLFK